MTRAEYPCIADRGVYCSCDICLPPLAVVQAKLDALRAAAERYYRHAPTSPSDYDAEIVAAIEASR